MKRGRLATIVLVLLCAAPVPGDIGACGQPVARLDATRFFYTNTLRQLDAMSAPLRWSRQREEWISCYCCPPNVARTKSGEATAPATSSRRASESGGFIPPSYATTGTMRQTVTASGTLQPADNWRISDS